MDVEPSTVPGSRQHLETLCPAAQAFVALLRTAAIARVGKQVDNKKLYSSVEFAPSCRFNALQQRAARRATEHIRAVTPGSMYPTATYTTSNGHNSIAVIWVRISFRPDSDGWQRTENAITLQHFESLTLPRSERIKLAILRARHQPIQTARTVGRKAAKVAKMAIVIPFNVVGTIAIAPIVILVYISLTLSDNHVRNNRLPTLPLHHVELFLYRLINGHACEKYDFSRDDVRATTCPLCGVVLPIVDLLKKADGQTSVDVNDAMTAHIDGGKCSIVNEQNGLLRPAQAQKLKAQKSPTTCPYPPCKIRMVISLPCEKCNISHCPSHRDPKQHRCSMLPSRTPSPVPHATQGGTVASTSSNTPSSPPSSSQNVFRSIKTAIKPSSNPTRSSSALTSPTSPVHQSKTLRVTATSPTRAKEPTENRLEASIKGMKEERTTSKRAAKERESAAAALKRRADKGLLTDDEKVRYATLQAIEARGGKSGKDSKDCCVQ
ncbi:hypothetical protein EMMF5_001206 [Cystobasidiomycetes sp. EMM_F5]